MDKNANTRVNQLNLDDLAYNVPLIGYEVVNRYSHDSDAFTEGLAYLDGFLYESAGPTDKTLSTLRQVEIQTGKPLKRYELPAKYFAEGLTVFGKEIFQLSLTGKGFVYDLVTFSLLKTFRYENEGWGLTNDGHHLIMSNGSHQLRLIDPNSFEVVGKPIDIFVNGKPLVRLNELEYVKGYIYANVWLTDFVYRINPLNGEVLGGIDLRALHPREIEDPDSCLNGIAWDKDSDHLFLTGKLWPTLFEIRLLP